MSSENKPTYKMPKLKRMEPIIKKSRDFYTGAAKVKDPKNVENYISRLTDESYEGYKKRVQVTAYVNRMQSAVAAFTGILAGRSADVSAFEKLLTGRRAKLFDFNNVDMKGNSFDAFIREVIENSLVGGIDFIIAEKAVVDGQERACLKRMPVESLMSYQDNDDNIDGGGDIGSKIVFRETIEKAFGLFGTKLQERYLVYRKRGGSSWYDDGEGRDDTGSSNTGAVSNANVNRQEVWENTIDNILVVDIKTGIEISKYEVIPLFYGLVDQSLSALNLESWQLSKMRSLGLFLMAIFQDNIVGKQYQQMDADGNPMHDTVEKRERHRDGEDVMSLEKDARVEMVEAHGHGLDHIQKKIEHADKRMDDSAYGLLSMESSGNQTRIESYENLLKLRSLASKTSAELASKLTLALRYALELVGVTVPYNVKVELEDDFDERILGKQSKADLFLSLYNAGAMSLELLIECMIAEGVYPSDTDIEKEKARINNVILDEYAPNPREEEEEKITVDNEE